LRYPMIFPGQASQSVGMGKGLFDDDKVTRELFAAAHQLLNLPLAELCFEGPLERLTETRYAQPAILAVSLACLGYLERAGARPSVVAGHSLGEYSALVAAGVLEPLRALELVALRGRLMFESGEKTPGTMAAIVGLDRARVEACCEEAAQGEVLQLANQNSPEQLVISGTVPAVERCMATCSAAGAKKAIPLTVSGAFHSALMATAAAELEAALADTEFEDAAVPVIPNVTAKAIRSGAKLRELLIRQLTEPVLWADSMIALRAIDAGEVQEVGPGRVLMGLMRRIDRSAKVTPLGDRQSMDAWLEKTRDKEECE
jgi:[acyl-carrier-protein] S-malonyltransferase